MNAVRPRKILNSEYEKADGNWLVLRVRGNRKSIVKS